MYYGLLYQAMHPEISKPLKPAIFNFKEIFKEDFNPYLKNKEQKSEVQDYIEYAVEYESALRKMLEEMYDPEVPFSQTDDLKKCAYCPYSGICGR